jgi:hypothetical protein
MGPSRSRSSPAINRLVKILLCIARRYGSARTNRVINGSEYGIPGRGHDECPIHRRRTCILPSTNSKCHYAVAAMVDRTDDIHRSSGWPCAAFRWQYRGPGRPHAHAKLLTPLSKVRYPQNLTEQLTQIATFLLTESRSVRRRSLSLLEGPKETRTRQPRLSQWLTSFAKETLVLRYSLILG